MRRFSNYNGPYKQRLPEILPHKGRTYLPSRHGIGYSSEALKRALHSGIIDQHIKPNNPTIPAGVWVDSWMLPTVKNSNRNVYFRLFAV